MITLEIHPREGGADAESFAAELGDAIAKHTGSTTSRDGRTIVLERL
ncbi:hypothetical protein [Ornithinimicrobium murale]|nr:hypothetical protein [Ornithinimicrobium murale]